MNLKRFLLVFFVFSSFNVFAQPSNLIFYTNNVTQKFRLFVNGELKNDNFQANVRLENIEARNYRIKIVFQNRMLGYIQKDIYIRPNTEKIYVFSKRRQTMGRRRPGSKINTSPLALNLLSETPLFSVDDEFMGESNDENDAISYTTGSCPEASNKFNVQNENGNVVIGTEKNNVSIGTNGIDVNIDVQDIINKVIKIEEDEETNVISDNSEENINKIESNNSNYAVEEIDNDNSCTPSFTDKQFRFILVRLEKEGFESKKLAIAEGVSKNNCLLTKQVRDVVHLFNFENNRVAFAKFAYQNVADKENYNLLLDSFKFETSKQEIRKYINEL